VLVKIINAHIKTYKELLYESYKELLPAN